MFWAKISGLDNKTLEKDGEEVAIFYQEKGMEKIDRRKKFLKKDKLRGKSESTPLAEWLPEHNQGERLAVDIYEDEKNNVLVIESMLAGVGAKDIDLTVEPDLIVIHGERKRIKDSESRRYYYQECPWGKFSRTIVLPCSVQPDQVKANFKNNILTVFLPKTKERVEGLKVE